MIVVCIHFFHAYNDRYWRAKETWQYEDDDTGKMVAREISKSKDVRYVSFQNDHEVRGYYYVDGAFIDVAHMTDKERTTLESRITWKATKA